MQVNTDNQYEKIELPQSRQTKREAGSEIPKVRRDPATIDFTNPNPSETPGLNTDERQ
jgi:hypothetical protein